MNGEKNVENDPQAKINRISDLRKLYLTLEEVYQTEKVRKAKRVLSNKIANLIVNLVDDGSSL